MAKKTIQFGWEMPLSANKTSQDDYLHGLQIGLKTISGHFDSAWLPDHLQFGDLHLLEGWTALTYLSALDDKLKFGHTVLCQFFRNPGHLAKMAATLQYMSRGRLILGIGAGWHEEEALAYNIEFPPPGKRVEETEDTLQILKALWSGDKVTVEGKHYKVKDAICNPKPDPIPPIIVASFQPRLLRITARYADWWNIVGRDLEKTRALVGDCERACNEVGRDPATLKRTFQAACLCAPTEKEVEALSKQAEIKGQAFKGTPAQVIEQLQPYIDLGFDYFMLSCEGFPNLTTLETLVNDVLPALNR